MGKSKRKSPIKKKKSRRREISYVGNRCKRQVTFSKRKTGVFKRGWELNKTTGAAVLIVLLSETGVVYGFKTRSFHHFAEKDELRKAYRSKSFPMSTVVHSELEPKPEPKIKMSPLINTEETQNDSDEYVSSGERPFLDQEDDFSM